MAGIALDPEGTYTVNKADNNPSPPRGPKEHSTEVTQVATRHMKRCSTLLGIREMQVKSTMCYTKYLPEGKRKEKKGTIPRFGRNVEQLNSYKLGI